MSPHRLTSFRMHTNDPSPSRAQAAERLARRDGNSAIRLLFYICNQFSESSGATLDLMTMHMMHRIVDA